MSIREKLENNPQFSLRYIDKTFWVLFALLILAAFIALFSASSTLIYKSATTIGPVARHFGYIVAGVIIVWIMQFMPTWMIRFMGYLMLGASVLCLWLMLVPGGAFSANINGATRWFKLGPISFQPSEFAKVGLMLVVADQLARMKDEATESKKYFLRTLAISGITIFPILTGNLSTAILMAGVVGIMWFLARINWKYIIGTAAVCVGLAVGGYFLVEFAFIRPHREVTGLFSRAVTWVSRVDDMIEEKKQTEEGGPTLNDDNYQRNLAKVAVARGGITPIGVGPGNSVERDFLPLAYADYIFAIIVEETGVVGACALIFLYLAILFRACFVSTRFDDTSAMLMVMGVALMLVIQAFVSMAVAVGIGPVTGQPLPMITRGGTAALGAALSFGVMMAVAREQNMLKGMQQQVEEDSAKDVPDIIDL